jgi:hypothetical protein
MLSGESIRTPKGWIMKPTCYTNANATEIKSAIGRFLHTIENQFYYDETPM